MEGTVLFKKIEITIEQWNRIAHLVLGNFSLREEETKMGAYILFSWIMPTSAPMLHLNCNKLRIYTLYALYLR